MYNEVEQLLSNKEMPKSLNPILGPLTIKWQTTPLKEFLVTLTDAVVTHRQSGKILNPEQTVAKAMDRHYTLLQRAKDYNPFIPSLSQIQVSSYCRTISNPATRMVDNILALIKNGDVNVLALETKFGKMSLAGYGPIITQLFIPSFFLKNVADLCLMGKGELEKFKNDLGDFTPQKAQQKVFDLPTREPSKITSLVSLLGEEGLHEWREKFSRNLFCHWGFGFRNHLLEQHLKLGPSPTMEQVLPIIKIHTKLGNELMHNSPTHAWEGLQTAMDEISTRPGFIVSGNLQEIFQRMQGQNQLKKGLGMLDFTDAAIASNAVTLFLKIISDGNSDLRKISPLN